MIICARGLSNSYSFQRNTFAFVDFLNIYSYFCYFFPSTFFQFVVSLYLLEIDLILIIVSILTLLIGGAHGKEPSANAGDLRDTGSSPGLIPGSGRSPWRRAWQPTPVFLPGESHGLRNLVGYRP